MDSLGCSRPLTRLPIVAGSQERCWLLELEFPQKAGSDWPRPWRTEEERTMLVVGVNEFLGSWLVNHDGLTGRLLLEGEGDPDEETFILRGRYEDAQGQRYRVDSISIDVHRISFIVYFTEHSQLFRGYLFTETRDAIAGYTIRGDVRYGWFAIQVDSPLVAE